jgi:peptidoglycan/LPS O-acetylase OafA/YrhL
VFFSHLPIYRVFGTESWHFCSGLAGVYLFFVISGFIITKTFGNQLIKINNFNLDQWYDTFIQNREQIFLFWYRRFLRLFPALCLLFCCSFLLTVRYGIKNHDISYTILTFFRQIATLIMLDCPFEYIRNLKSYIANIIGVTWSLTFEILFYLVFPCVVIFKDFQRILLLVLIIAFIACNSRFLPFYAFILGVLVAVYHEKIKLNKNVTRVITVAALYVLIISDLHPIIESKYYSTYIIASAFLIYITSMQKNILYLPIIGPILNFIGVRSYFIYLMHNIISKILNLSILKYASDYIPHLKLLFFKGSITLYHIQNILVLIVVIILADLFYRFVERPFIERNRHKILYKVRKFTKHGMCNT